MTARQQLARLLALAALVALAIIGLRGQAAAPAWDGPLKAYGVVIGIALEVILGALLLITYYREHAARRKADEALLAASAARASSGWVTPAAGAAPAPGALMSAAMTAPVPAPEDVSGDDRDVAASLRFLLRLLLGTAMAAIGAVLVMNLHLHLFRANGIARRGLLPNSGQHRPLPPSAAGHFHLPVTPVLYGVLSVALVAALVLSAWWGRRLALEAALPGAEPGDFAEDPQGLREAVASGRAAMADLDDARAAIIACYTAMEQSLAERGTERGAAGTPDELLSRAVAGGLVRGSGARQLTALFYEARFSTHPLGARQRDRATAALDEIATELGAAAGTTL
jgi:hypothetical protein